MCLADEGMETAYHGQAEYAVSAGGGGGVLTVSSIEVDQLKAELQKQHAYIAVKNDEIVSLSQKLAQAEAEVIKQKMQVAQLQTAMQANETSPEMQRYVACIRRFTVSATLKSCAANDAQVQTVGATGGDNHSAL